MLNDIDAVVESFIESIEKVGDKRAISVGTLARRLDRDFNF